MMGVHILKKIINQEKQKTSKIECNPILEGNMNILKQYSKTYFSPKSYNNHYGVPLSLSNLEKSHRYGVFEIGMSKKGEINKLSKIVKPDIGVITNISQAHLENFKNVMGIAKAKEIVYTGKMVKADEAKEKKNGQI